MLLGNHEEMNITGIALDYPDYVTVEQFVSFLPEDFRRERQAEYLKTLSPEDRKRAEIEGLDVHADERLAEFWRKIMAAKDPDAMRAYVLGFNKACGDWLIKKNTVIKINDVIYAHAGVTEAFSKWPIREINQVMRSESRSSRGACAIPGNTASRSTPGSSITRTARFGSGGWPPRTGPRPRPRSTGHWPTSEPGPSSSVTITSAFPSGSSPTVDRRSVSRFQDKVWIMDTGISSGSYGGVPSALIYDHGEFRVWGETEEVAARSGIRRPAPKPLMTREMEAFLRAAAVSGRGPGPGGRTDAWRLTLESQGTVLEALFRYIDRRWPDPLADSFRYDLAAYALNKYLGLNVPPIVERTVEDVPGPCRPSSPTPGPWPISGTRRPSRLTRGLRAGPGRPHRVPGPRPRRLPERQGHPGRRGRPDLQSISPRPSPRRRGCRPGCEIRRCSRLLYRRLLGWEDRTVSAYLGRYLGPEEIEALNTRRTFIVRRLRMMIKSLGEANVLF